MNLRSALIATDFSDEARFAARRAAGIAREAGIGGELAHVIPGTIPPALHVLAATRAREALAMAADECRQQGASFGTRLLTGNVAEELVSAARAHDLAVAGARGEDIVLYRFALGRTSVRLVQESEGAVLIVKRAVEGAYRRVVVGIDLSPASRSAALLAAQLAPAAHLELVHAFEVPYESTLRRSGTDEDTIERYRAEANAAALASIASFSAALPIAPERLSTIVLRGYPPKVLLDRVEAADARLVVLGKGSAGAVERFLVGSVALQVLELAPCDVLIVPAERA
jgi:nucleotide-binding universal stress UspA family protein